MTRPTADQVSRLRSLAGRVASGEILEADAVAEADRIDPVAGRHALHARLAIDPRLRT